MSIDEVIKMIKDVSMSHINVNSFSTGENFEFAVGGREVYSTVHLQQPFLISANGANKKNIRCQILVLDKTDVAEVGEDEMLAKCENIFLDIIYKINEDYEELGTLTNDWTLTTVTEYSDNLDCGIIADINFTCLIQTNRCDVNYSFDE